MAIRLPGNGTGALPLLRHVIMNDDKSSTYKLALLRSARRHSPIQLGVCSAPQSGMSLTNLEFMGDAKPANRSVLLAVFIKTREKIISYHNILNH